jgi:hypothetical protein
MNNESNVNNINLCIAEVIDSAPLDTYKYSENYYNLFSVTARVDGYVNKPVVTAKPANTNMKKIPLIGEMILLFQLNSSVPSNETYKQNQWYYLSTVDIVSSVNHNVLTGYTSNVEQKQQVGKVFTEQSISPIQPYEGDVILEGRSGNSIRFGSVVTGGSFYTVSQQSKITGELGSPIIMLSNGRKNKPAKEFIHEDIQLDDSSLYLTSKQSIPGLKLNYPLTKGNAAASFNKSQLIGVADRIVLSAKTDIAVIDAKLGIEINSSDIRFGESTTKEPMLQSTAVLELLQIIIRTIQTGFKDSSGIICTPINKELNNTGNITKLFKESTNKRMLMDVWKA